MAYSIPLLLKYTINQMAAGQPRDLVVLHELIGRMAGIVPFADLSDDQVMTLAGGKVMRNEVFHQTDLSELGKERQIAALVGSRQRLSNQLKNSGLASTLLISLAVQRQACCTSSTNLQLKPLAALYDEVDFFPLPLMQTSIP